MFIDIAAAKEVLTDPGKSLFARVNSFAYFKMIDYHFCSSFSFRVICIKNH